MIKINIFEYNLANSCDLLCTITFRKQIDITLHFFDQIDRYLLHLFYFIKSLLPNLVLSSMSILNAYSGQKMKS